MGGYCLKDGMLQAGCGMGEGIVPAAIYHLSPDGSWRRMPDIPTLQAGEGMLLYAGDFASPLWRSRWSSLRPPMGSNGCKGWSCAMWSGCGRSTPAYMRWRK